MKTGLHALSATLIPVLPPEARVADALELIRSTEFEDSTHIYVTDPQGLLLGSASLGSLIKSRPEDPLAAILKPCRSIDSRKSLGYAANHAIKAQINTLPVTDHDGKLLGVIPAQVLIETLRKEHVEDIHRLAGIQKERADASEAITEPPIRSVWHRMPWLLAGLVGSFIATFIMSRFEKTLGGNISLAFFIPGIVYLADAIGTQTETIVIRGLSLSWSNFLVTLRREFLTGWLIGVILALVSIPVALLGGYGWQVSVIVGISIMMAGTLATTIGLLLPWLIMKMGKDPAFGSGPLATIIQDILSILVFFLTAKAILGGF